jgi:hypothetical protein
MAQSQPYDPLATFAAACKALREKEKAESDEASKNANSARTMPQESETYARERPRGEVVGSGGI